MLAKPFRKEFLTATGGLGLSCDRTSARDSTGGGGVWCNSWVQQQKDGHESR
jgi:hypothetical protein